MKPFPKDRKGSNVGIESRSLLSEKGLDLEQLTVGCLSQSARERLGLRLEEKREALLIELIFAARNLAYFNVRYQRPKDDQPVDPFVRVSDGLRCDDCKLEQQRLPSGELKGEHTRECRTGAVLRIVESLVGLEQFAPNAFDAGQPFIYRSVERPSKAACKHCGPCAPSCHENGGRQ